MDDHGQNGSVIWRWIILVKGTLALIAALAFSTDYLVWRVGGWTGHNLYGSCVVTTYYSIPHKNNKVEFLPGETFDEVCVRSVLPHQGHKPCWYLSRHTERQIEE